MFRAKDVMVEAVVAVPSDMPIYDAIRLLIGRNITGLPVVNEKLNVVGVLSEKDVLKLLYATEDRAHHTVADYMSTDVVSFDENDSLIDLCDCLLDNPFRRVPITRRGKLCGIASRRDVIRAILELKHQEIRTHNRRCRPEPVASRP